MLVHQRVRTIASGMIFIQKWDKILCWLREKAVDDEKKQLFLASQGFGTEKGDEYVPGFLQRTIKGMLGVIKKKQRFWRFWWISLASTKLIRNLKTSDFSEKHGIELEDGYPLVIQHGCGQMMCTCDALFSCWCSSEELCSSPGNVTAARFRIQLGAYL